MAQTTDDYGNVTGSFSDYTKRNAHIVERLGKDEIEGGALQDVAMATLRVRSDAITKAITVADRVVARNVYWAIKSIMQVTARGDILEMRLERGVAT
jgi:head-tail adaptor